MLPPRRCRWLYSQFAARHKPASHAADAGASGTKPAVLDAAAVLMQLRKMMSSAENEMDVVIMAKIAEFNAAVLRTNFYRAHIIALSFRLDAKLLKSSYPADAVPFGIFFVVGAEFRAFHVRFSDVARGGIRIVMSASAQAYAKNLSSVFDECYGLAWTQQVRFSSFPWRASLVRHDAHPETPFIPWYPFSRRKRIKTSSRAAPRASFC